MMTSAEIYIKDYADKSFEELILIRKELINNLYDFEEEYVEGLSDQGMIIAPSPDVMYQMHNRYLIALTKLINEKFNKIVNE